MERKWGKMNNSKLKILELLKLPVDGGPFTVEGRDKQFRITDNLLIYETGTNCLAPFTFREVILGEVTVQWRPRLGERYWFPDFDSPDNAMYGYWENNLIPHRRMRRVGIYQTREEAIEKAEELWGE